MRRQRRQRPRPASNVDAETRAHAQSVRRMFEDYELTTEAIARRSGATQATVRAYLRHAFSEPPETRFLWHREWRSQARAAAVKTERYWRAKHRAAPSPAAKADVLAQYAEHQRELELQVSGP